MAMDIPSETPAFLSVDAVSVSGYVSDLAWVNFPQETRA